LAEAYLLTGKIERFGAVYQGNPLIRLFMVQTNALVIAAPFDKLRVT
jgi:hypothetical protein